MLGQPQSVQCQQHWAASDEPALAKRVMELAGDYRRCVHRRVTAMLREEGFRVNHKRVERLWRREGLKVPQRQPKRQRLWLNDGSCIRQRPRYCNHVWSCDFTADLTSDGRALKLLTITGEYWTHFGRRGCWWRDGGGTTMQYGRAVRRATDRRTRRQSNPATRAGIDATARLRPRRPLAQHSRWYHSCGQAKVADLSRHSRLPTTGFGQGTVSGDSTEAEQCYIS